MGEAKVLRFPPRPCPSCEASARFMVRKGLFIVCGRCGYSWKPRSDYGGNSHRRR